MTLRVDGGSVWTGENLQQVSVLIQDGRICGFLAPEVAADVPATEVVQADGLWVLPGGVDLHVHVSDGVEDFESGTRCAAVGGIGTLLDMAPFHGCVKPEQYRQKVELAQARSVIDFGLIAGIVVDETDLQHLRELAELGAAMVKLFMPAVPCSSRLLWQAVQVAARTGLRLALHAEEPGFLSSEVDWSDPRGFARARPIVAETSAVARALEMARAAGAPLHICHVSSGRAAELIAREKARGTDVTAEVPVHFLLLDERDFDRYGPRVKTTPPLRTPQDAQALWSALSDGTLDAVASDHFLGNLTPLPVAIGEMQQAPAGIAGLEASLPLLLSRGVLEGRLSLARFVQASAQRPATIARLSPRKGQLTVGADADLVFFDPSAAWTLDTQGWFSRVQTTPYVGWPLRGRIRRTMVRGRTVWDGENITVESGWGQYIPSQGRRA